MSNYKITQYSYDKAKELNVRIEPSKSKAKKIDVYDMNDNFLVSIGASGYKDYPTYVQENGADYANERSRLYKLRHKNNINNAESAGYYANKILW